MTTRASHVYMKLKVF